MRSRLVDKSQGADDEPNCPTESNVSYPKVPTIIWLGVYPTLLQTQIPCPEEPFQGKYAIAQFVSIFNFKLNNFFSIGNFNINRKYLYFFSFLLTNHDRVWRSRNIILRATVILGTFHDKYLSAQVIIEYIVYARTRYTVQIILNVLFAKFDMCIVMRQN